MHIRRMAAILAFGWGLAGLAGADTHYVDAGSTNAEPPFTSWDKAATNIQQAINEAADNDEVVITNGVYTADGTGALDGGAYLKDAGGLSMITVVKAVTVRGASGNRDDVILNGNGLAVPNRVAFLGHYGARLESVTLTNGLAITNGGGAYLYRGTMSNCVVVNNVASNAGGGLYLATVAVTATHCRIDKNLNYSIGDPYYAYAGGVQMVNGYLSQCQLAGNTNIKGAIYDGVCGMVIKAGTVQSCIISNNRSTAPMAAIVSGGDTWVKDCQFVNNYRGLHLYSTSDKKVTISNCTFASNAEVGLWVDTFKMTILDCVFSNNTGFGMSFRQSMGLPPRDNKGSNVAYGCTFVNGKSTGLTIDSPYNIVSNCVFRANYAGGLWMRSESKPYSFSNLITHCEFANNTNSSYGGGIRMDGTSAYETVQFCRIVSNNCKAASGGGGGLYSVSGGLLRNNLIAGNTARVYGGGVYGGQLTNESCTIAGNVASNSGGGLYLTSNGNAVVNCMIADNTGVLGNADVRLPSDAEASVFTYTCTRGVTNEAGHNLQADPAWADGSYRLAADSPGVNAGLNAEWMDAALDLDGHPRIHALCGVADMGAYERRESGTLLKMR